MIRYTLLRLVVFAGCLGLLWLLGLRSQEQQIWLVLGAAVASTVVSYVVLRGERERMTEAITARVQRGVDQRAKRGPTDEEVEDSAS